MKKKTVSTIDSIRKEEFEITFLKLNLKNYDNKVLEIGCGSGCQLELLASIFSEAKGIDIDNAAFMAVRSEAVMIYDGYNFPFKDSSFDVVFSSNTLEHIPDLQRNDTEIKRVLVDSGICIHILPSHYWRLWSVIVHYFILPFIVYKRLKKYFKLQIIDGKSQLIQVKKSGSAKNANRFKREIGNLIFPAKHGARGNRFNEYFLFKPKAWITFFKKSNWDLVDYFPLGIFYSGHSLFGNILSLNIRKKISKFLGSACFCYVVKK